MTPARHAMRTGLLALMVVGAVGPAPAQPAERMFVAPAQQPVNVGDAKLAANAYHRSGAYEREIAAIAAQAADWVARRAPQVSRPAVVFDIDETLLSNWQVIRRDDFGRPIAGPCPSPPDTACGWAAWDMIGADTPIAPTRDLFEKARGLGAALFLISGRPESQRAATERNLAAAGLSGYARLDLVADGAQYASLVDFKAPRRAGIEAAGYTIIANIGDQPSDLFGGHAERAFQLPNPFYRIP